MSNESKKCYLGDNPLVGEKIVQHRHGFVITANVQISSSEVSSMAREIVQYLLRVEGGEQLAHIFMADAIGQPPLDGKSGRLEFLQVKWGPRIKSIYLHLRLGADTPLSRNNLNHPRIQTSDRTICVILPTQEELVYLVVPKWKYELFSDLYLAGLQDPDAVVEDPEGPITFKCIEEDWRRTEIEMPVEFSLKSKIRV